MGDAAQAWDTFKCLMRDDPEYAWSWHCNLAVPIMDAINVSHEDANLAAAYLMSYLFDCDITQHPAYLYGKTGAQQYHEFQLEMDRQEDATSAGGRIMGEIVTLRAANQSDDPRVELAIRGFELERAEALFRMTNVWDEAAFTMADDELFERRKAYREQLAKVTGQDSDMIEKRLAL